MFIRANKHRKNGKLHTYYNVVENRRLADGGSVQRQALYLGEISSQQEESWQRIARLIGAIVKFCGQRRTGGGRFAVFTQSRVEYQQFTCTRSNYLGCTG